MALTPIAENLFTWPADQPELIGGRRRGTGEIVFPFSGAPGDERIHLKREGFLWSWTVQRFPPKRPPYRGPVALESFTPFAVGYVELPQQVRVESRLVDCEPQELRIGMPMELAIVPLGSPALGSEPGGSDVMIFAFRPLRRPSRDARPP